MKQLRPIILFSLLTIAWSAIGQEGAVNHLTLKECLEYAFEHNENIIIANLEIDASKAKTGEYLSAGFPQIDATASINKNFILRKAFLPKSFMVPGAPEGEFIEIAFGTPYDGDMGVNLNQMIFNGSYFVGVKASKTFQELSRKDHIKSKIDVTEAVTKAYYSVLVNQMLLETIVSNYQRLDSLVRETSIMQENGFVELLDLNRTKVEYNNIKTQKSNAERAVEISKALLKFQMGMPVVNSIEITDKLSDLNFNVEEELKMAYSHQRRIEYSRLETSKQLAELEMKNNKVQYLPNIDLFFSWGMNAGVSEFNKLGDFSNRMVWPTYQLAGLSFTLPIFDGLYKSKKIQQNKIKLQQLDYQRQMLENSIEMEVNQMRKTLIMNLDQLQNQEENAELAASVYNQTKIKYQEGVGTNLEVIEADNAYKQAQSNYFNALFDALIAHVDYQKALGILKID
ncbi:MAG: TolC family protein [Cyclobacteriaceae bacterium]|nr:TolC family protein [Cyclobacteriaceae bacterium]